ncbi:hypothetical protein [Roseofilum casamattae]|uniref:DNA helicase n=1 Tax=Roseofilum casamattae BLCC-M143 TaxID=3022442 RepID=A0ABT7BTW2_9CYAN|nr:hypothetical protein [Roseofilum casamattae]MDJ1182627.1 hypothetical protein [Roseofilum casamattae BLCC-M143]
MYVYRTAQFNRKIEKHSLEVPLSRFCDKMSRRSIEEVRALFKSNRLGPYLKKRLNDRNIRAIAQIVPVTTAEDEENSSVLVFFDLFIRGTGEYEDFIPEATASSPGYIDPQIPLAEVQRWFREQHDRDRQPTPRPRLTQSPGLLPWLNLPDWNGDREAVYESEIWKPQLQRPEMRSRVGKYHQLVDRLSCGPQPTERQTQWSGVLLYGEDHCYILFSRITLASAPTPILFLLYPFAREPSAAEINEIGDRTHLYNSSKNHLEHPTSLNQIKTFSRHYYPLLLLAEDNWLIRDSPHKSNLPLSDEEESLLKSVSTPDTPSFPLFLNGQAGSGKSTLLFYLFSDYCYRKYYNITGEELQGNPIFLTYSQRLLDVAKDEVKHLLKFHHHYISLLPPGTTIPAINEFFKPFQTFLLNQLPPEAREHFGLDKYISFHHFKRLYKEECTLPIAKSYSPERCWHAIRTFIKGYQLAEMTVADYEDKVRQKEKTISAREFQAIYSIWENWYQKIAQERGYWDDQDLIKTILQLDIDLARYTAIFCDESQDFTHLELQLILRLSVFSKYDLGYHPLKNLPFVFAGDPFQTLNPTGFRWESFKAAFYQEVIEKLDPKRQLKLEMNFQDLECNYRSYSPIVKFNNLIQFWRYVLFKHHNLKAQRVWKQGNVLPEKFILDDNLSAETLQEYIRNTIIIVPCEEGEERDYVKRDNVLSRVLEPSVAGEPPKNVLSAIAAKGLEFKRVVLYKFGEACDRQLWKLLETETSEPTVEIEYFFNKLYVASSRAIERLFIVDTPLGNEQLWNRISNPERVQSVWHRLKQAQEWENRLQYLHVGTDESAKKIEEDDLYSIARQFEHNGLNSSDPSSMRQAKQYYEEIGDFKQAHWCEAWALQFNGKYAKAGLEFLQLGKAEQAWDCFWEGLCWQQLHQWYNEVSDNPKLRDRHALEAPLVDFMAAETPNEIDRLVTLTEELQVYQKRQNLSQYCFLPQWKAAANAYRQQIETIAEEAELSPSIWQSMGQVLQRLSEAGYGDMLSCAGVCFYRGQNYQNAVNCFTRADDMKRREYYLAQTETIGLPEGLEYLKLAGELPNGARGADELIYTAWETAGSAYTAEWLDYIAPILERRQDYERAFRAYLHQQKFEALPACFEAIDDTSPSLELLRLWLTALVEAEQWIELLQCFDRYRQKQLNNITEKTEVVADIIYQLAHSPLRHDRLSKTERQRYESFIEEHFLAQPNWETYLLMEHVGIALEKIGGWGATLKFYQPFCDSDRPDSQRIFARTRWLATKKKQENAFNTKGNTKKLIAIQQELSRKQQQWNLKLDAIAIHPPAAPKERPSPKPSPQREVAIAAAPTVTLSSEAQDRAVRIQGLPEGVEVKTISFGVQWFSWKHLVVKINARAKQVLIADILTGDRLRIDLSTATIAYKTFSIQGSLTEPLSFSSSDSRYRGRLQPGDPPSVHLSLDDREIALKF